MRVHNPFFHRGAIRQSKDFFGRKAEIQEILGLLHNGQSVSLIGARRIGKSSLLLHLCRPEAKENAGKDFRTVFVNVDCQELGGSPAEEVYETFLIGLLDAADAEGIDIERVQHNPGTYRALDRALHQISRKHVIPIMLLDEFELLAANQNLTPYFFARLRGLTTKYGLAYLTASQRPLFSITAEEEILSSPFFNIFVTLALGLFTHVEAEALLLARLTDSDIHFSDDLIAYLIFLVGPNPFFLHIAGYHAFQMLAQGRQLETESDFSQLDGPIEIEAGSHLAYLWQNLTSVEQYALAIADGPIDSLRLLEQQCLLQEHDGAYEYTSEILRRFVRRQEVNGLIQAGPFVIDEQRHQVWANGHDMGLTTSQFSILTRLCQHAGQVVHGDDLETAVWGDVLVNDPDRLKTLIKRLRRAIVPYDTWIISERGVGYALRSPD